MESHIMKIFTVCLAIFSSVAHSKMPEKIQGGVKTSIGEFPYMASIRVWELHRCGGSILTENHVLSAAHCFTDYHEMSKDFRVLCGTNDQNDEMTGQIRRIKLVISHEHFNPNDSLRNDIAVLELEHPLFFSTILQPIQLPTSNIEVYTKVMASGWGLLDFNARTASRYLQKLQFDVISNDLCMEYYSLKPIYPEQICALRGPGYGLRRGDSGSPIVYEKQIVGIASANSHLFPDQIIPDVFTRVYYFIPWIEDVIYGYKCFNKRSNRNSYEHELQSSTSTLCFESQKYRSNES